MPKITVLPSKIDFEGDRDETVMAAALRNGLHWPSVCGGAASCGACVFVTATPERLSPIATAEAAVLGGRVGGPANGMTARLACQAHALRDLAVIRRGVRPRR